MAADGLENQQKLAERVQASLQNAQQTVTGYQKTHRRLMITSVFSSAVTTLVAGVTAAVGQAAQIGTPGWRTACIVAAIFGFISTMSTGFTQQLGTSDRLAEGKHCVAQLKLLEIAVSTQSKSWPELAREFEDIAKAYPEYI
jgi:hypothetical protein